MSTGNGDRRPARGAVSLLVRGTLWIMVAVQTTLTLLVLAFGGETRWMALITASSIGLMLYGLKHA